jgi:hypothetical protein
MTPSKSTEKQQHGHYTLHRALKTVSNQDGWIENLGEVGEALKVWRESLIADLGGEGNISVMERSIIELATRLTVNTSPCANCVSVGQSKSMRITQRGCETLQSEAVVES